MEFFCNVVRFHLTNYLLDGLTKEYKISELVKGFTTKLSDKINTGDQMQGNLYIDDVVTPVLNYWKGPTSGRSFTMMQGVESAL